MEIVPLPQDAAIIIRENFNRSSEIRSYAPLLATCAALGATEDPSMPGPLEYAPLLTWAALAGKLGA